MSVGPEKLEILIVDDIPSNIKILSETLKADYKIRFAKSGQKAIELISQDKPDLILLDIMMPEMDGYEVCKRLKSNETMKDIPVIFISAMDEEDDETKGFKLGAVDYIIKPFKPAIVRARVRVHLELKQNRQHLEDKVKECKSAEDEIRLLNQKLEYKVTDRTEKLKNAQKEIIRTEYKSELADISTGTLHNVKNIINSVKISSEAVKRLTDIPLKALKKANHMLGDNITDFKNDHVKMENFFQYYLKLEETVKSETEKARSHLERLQEKVDMIEQIITAQQEYGGADLTEKVAIKDMFDDALIIQAELIKRNDIQVTKAFDEVPQIYVQKAKFIHILINLIKNAIEAMLDTPQCEKVLALAINGSDDTVLIKITDNGQGISKENFDTLFTHGFTTKKNGHGFGLHSSSSYIKEMGGEIWAESDGEGKGTKFIIKFPVS